ncbi:MAG: hypothetical protein NZ578_03930 [Candidatus Binatia bacterium]|nr:hypothetical protein [Candidatus Binatia bacterium]
MARHRVISMEKRKDRVRRYAGYRCTLDNGQTVHAWVAADTLDLEFHGIDLKVACKLAVERASDAALASGEVIVPRQLLIEVETGERSSGRGR